jgi:hypothetical protein
LESGTLSSKRILFTVLAVLLFAVFAFQLLYHAVRTSATVDEPFHILAGHRHWQCGDCCYLTEKVARKNNNE